MVLMDSCLAGSMKAQVLTTMTSASSGRGVSSYPWLRQDSQHHLAVHKILGTAQTYHSDFFGHKVYVSRLYLECVVTRNSTQKWVRVLMGRGSRDDCYSGTIP